MAGLGAAFLAGGHLGRGGRLRFEGSLRRQGLESVLEIADEGFEDEHPSLQLPTPGALGNRIGERGVHGRSMPESKGKRKINRDGVNGYQNSTGKPDRKRLAANAGLG